jgi:hypothetical protein
MNMRLTGVDWRPFQKEFPILFGAGKFVSLWVADTLGAEEVVQRSVQNL